MTTAGWTNHAQWSGAPCPAYHLNIVAVNDLPTGKAVTFFIERTPCAIPVEVPQNLQFIGIRELDGRKERHRIEASQAANRATIGRTANRHIGESLMARSWRRQASDLWGAVMSCRSKGYIQQRTPARSQVMTKRGVDGKQREHILEQTAIATNHMLAYCAAHPQSPSTLRRPRLLFRGQLWIAILGASMEHGIVGIGPTVGAALRAFDTQYLAATRRRSSP